MTRIVIDREPIDPVNVVRNPKLAAEWKTWWTYCWYCNDNTPGHYDVHHIVGGANRSDELCNYAFFCRDCHEFIESLESLSGVRVCMRFKVLKDRKNYNRPRIEALFGRRLDQ